MWGMESGIGVTVKRSDITHGLNKRSNYIFLLASVIPARMPENLARYPDAPRRVYRRGNGYLRETAKRFTRLPPGHPEAFIEAFANIYLEAARAIEADVEGRPVPPDVDFPNVDDGVLGMAFIDAAVKSANAGATWTKFNPA